MIKKIALLAPKDQLSSPSVCTLQHALQQKNIETGCFATSDDIPAFDPDLVIALSPQDAKLTHYPTYGLINHSKKEYLELPRFLRNLLTYDGYLTTSPLLTEMLQDVMFGARKLHSGIGFFDIPAETGLLAPNSLASAFTHVMAHEVHPATSSYKNVFSFLTHRCPHFKLEKKLSGQALAKAYREAGVGLCLQTGEATHQGIAQELLNIVASGALAIATHSPTLEKYFGDNILYISPEHNVDAVCQKINDYFAWIQTNPEKCAVMLKNALAIFQQHFSFDIYLENLNQLHHNTLIKKGFIPDPQENPDNLPSVSYIIRTGGRNRPLLVRALDSLIGQQYPKLRAIFCIYKDFDYMEELIQLYPSLEITVVKGYQSIRSKAICDGMAAVKTDLFGLLDDDDELHPNHVRSLVRTLHYHHHRDWRGPIGMAYSGSIIVNDSQPVHEKSEFQDLKLVNRQEHRVIEHYRFYRPGQMAQHNWFMMSNSWLAKASLIDSELLTDPSIDTCEDLYFELQIAQKTHFAFSAEVTVYHHFHSVGNSTIVDSSKHIPDTQRIALRNFSRSFPGEFQYDTPYNLIGREVNPKLSTPIAYQDAEALAPYQMLFAINPFYLDRGVNNVYPTNPWPPASSTPSSNKYFFWQLPIKFIALDRKEKKLLLHKAMRYRRNYGLTSFLKRCFTYNDHDLQRLMIEANGGLNRLSLKEAYMKLRIHIKYFGFKATTLKVMKRAYNRFR